VFGVADPEWGQVVAAAVVTGEAPPDDALLAAHLSARLAPHKRPRRLCRIDALPQTAAGKPDRAALGAYAAQLAPLAYPRRSD
jgi:O-succinylbenzoic acid--CoA ligase